MANQKVYVLRRNQEAEPHWKTRYTAVRDNRAAINKERRGVLDSGLPMTVLVVHDWKPLPFSQNYIHTCPNCQHSVIEGHDLLDNTGKAIIAYCLNCDMSWNG